jgi:hypothetical protein
LRRFFRELSSDRIARAGLLLALIVLCSITWRKWGYLPVDVGREMYVPAAIAEGKRLYFDLWYPYGPLIPYWHGALFRLFGIHLGLLLGAGIAVVTITATVLYSVGRMFLPVWLSYTAVFAFLVQAFQLNIFNYVLPYSYPSAYGALFSVLLAWLLLRHIKEPRFNYIVPAAFLACLMMLTKLEFGVAGYVAIGCALATQRIRAKSTRGLVEGLVACIPGVLIWLGIYGWYVHAGGLDFFFGENLSILPDSYFVAHFGKLWAEWLGMVFTPSALLLSISKGFLSFGLLVGGIVLAARHRLARWLVPAVALGLCATALSPAVLRIAHLDPKNAHRAIGFVWFNSGMFWISFVGSLAAAVAWWRGDEPMKQQSTILLCAMAMACSFRVFTKIAPERYPVFYDTLVYLVWLVGLYRMSKRFGVSLDGAAGKGVAGILCISLVASTLPNYPIGQRPSKISSERGTIYAAAPFGEYFSQVMAFMESAKQRSERVVVMPEDTALYFFSGTGAPSRWYLVLPQVLAPGDATAKYIDELERANIRYVIVSDRATPEYGRPVFGIDYAQQVLAWVHEHYRVVQRIGEYEAVAHPSEWGVLIYERK